MQLLSFRLKRIVILNNSVYIKENGAKFRNYFKTISKQLLLCPVVDDHIWLPSCDGSHHKPRSCWARFGRSVCGHIRASALRLPGWLPLALCTFAARKQYVHTHRMLVRSHVSVFCAQTSFGAILCGIVYMVRAQHLVDGCAAQRKRPAHCHAPHARQVCPPVSA